MTEKEKLTYHQQWRKDHPNHHKKWQEKNGLLYQKKVLSKSDIQKMVMDRKRRQTASGHRETIFTGGYDWENHKGEQYPVHGYNEGEVL